MQIDTEIKVSFQTSIGDSFQDNEDAEVIGEQIEEHIKDFCEEHHIDRQDVQIVEPQLYKVVEVEEFARCLKLIKVRMNEEIKLCNELKEVLLNLTIKERSDLIAMAFTHDIESIRRMVRSKWLIEFYEEVLFKWIITNIDERIKEAEK